MTIHGPIVCGVDFSPTSNVALERACEFAKLLGAELHLVHAYTIPVVTMPEGMVMAGPEAVSSLLADAQAELDRAKAKAKSLGVEAKTHLVDGVSASEVNRVADAVRAGLIVVGTHGRTGLVRVALGSVAENIVRHSKCPVVVVPVHR